MIEKPGGLQMKGSGKRNGRSCSLQTALHHTIVEAEEPDDSEYGDATHFKVAQYTSMVTIAAGHIEELEYPGHMGELGYPGHIEELGLPGHTGELGLPGYTEARTCRSSQWRPPRYGAARIPI